MNFAREDGYIFSVGEPVLQDRYPRRDALAARVVSYCKCCHVVALYDVDGDEESQPVFEPACALMTIAEWEQTNDADWPEDDGFEVFRTENPQLFTDEASGKRFSIDPEEVVRRLSGEHIVGELGRITIERSAVTSSPYRYVYVYLTDAQLDGPHAVISDLREFENKDGYIVGVYEGGEESLFSMTEPQTLDDVVRVLRQEIQEMYAERG